MPETHDDVIREKGLPRVGDTVRSKKHGTLRSHLSTDHLETARR
jgi:hypothetical protein